MVACKSLNGFKYAFGFAKFGPEGRLSDFGRTEIDKIKYSERENKHANSSEMIKNIWIHVKKSKMRSTVQKLGTKLVYVQKGPKIGISCHIPINSRFEVLKGLLCHLGLIGS